MNGEILTYKKKLCDAFSRSGACKNGKECTFAHGNRELRSFENPIFKSQMCTAFEQGGNCQWGLKCLLAHGENELRADDIPLGTNNLASGPYLQSFASDVLVSSTPVGSESKKGTYKTALCIHFMKHGSCHLELSCTFAHGKEDLANVTAPDTSDPKYKTKLCLRFEQDDFCPNGELCVFAHGEKELKVQTATANKKTALFKTTLCHNFISLGICPSGKNCSFAHGRYELRPVGFDGDFDAKIAENPKWKCVQCKIFLQAGHCNRINCDYAHGEDELRHENPDVPKQIKGNYKTVMCNKFARGFCHHEEACTFAHGQHELNSGKDATSALKIIRETNVLRKRTKGANIQNNVPPMGQMNPFLAAAFPTDQKLFAEFLEFKKMKQQNDQTAAQVMPTYFNGSPSPQMRAPAGVPSIPGAFDPLKVLNNQPPQNFFNDLVSQTAAYYPTSEYGVQDESVGRNAVANRNIKREATGARYNPMNGNHTNARFDRHQKMFQTQQRGPQPEYTY